MSSSAKLMIQRNPGFTTRIRQPHKKEQTAKIIDHEEGKKISGPFILNNPSTKMTRFGFFGHV
jgi:hypothetical protein